MFKHTHKHPYENWPPAVFSHPLFDHPHSHRWGLGFSFAWPSSKDQPLDPWWSPRWLGPRTCGTEDSHRTQVLSSSPKAWKTKRPSRYVHLPNCKLWFSWQNKLTNECNFKIFWNYLGFMHCWGMRRRIERTICKVLTC